VGVGSARPVVSTSMRLKLGTSPLARLRNSSLMVRTRSPRSVQDRQSEFRVTMPSSSDFSTKRWSSPISPNSLMITAVSASSGRRRSLFKSVVLPLPRKPVSTVTGMRCSAAFCVSLIFRLRSYLDAPEARGLPEFPPHPLDLAAAAFSAGCRLPGERLERVLHVLRRTGRGRQGGQHIGCHRAIVPGAQRPLPAHRRLDLMPPSPPCHGE